MMTLKNGFYPALGTPLDAEGNLVKRSFQNHIEQMIDAGASGLLVMGSMGQQPYIKADQCYETAKLAVEVNHGRLPIFCGAMDNSAARAKERIAALEDLKLDGIVLTTPYYNVFGPADVMNYFKTVAASTKHNIFLYDLAAVTKIKITFDMVTQMIKDIPNLKGMKSGDIELVRNLKQCPHIPESFEILFSGLDIFDVAYGYGITKNLDGMFCCTPKNGKKMYDALAAGDYQTASDCLYNIICMRGVMIKYNVFPSFTVVMNALGCEGNFAPDFLLPVGEQGKAELVAELKRIGELA